MNFHIDGDQLTVRLEGAEQLWALKRSIGLARTQIDHMDWHETLVVPRRELGWRFGTAIPGGLFAGRYTSGAARNFLYVQQTRGLFGEITMRHVLLLEVHDAQFDRIYLTVDDPDMAEQLVAWWVAAQTG